MKIHGSDIHFCVSCFHNGLDVIKYAKSYTLYSKQGCEIDFGGLPKIDIPNVGYNLLAYFKFIIDHYTDLPQHVLFVKNNVFPRHMTEANFKLLLENGESSFFDPHTIVYNYPFAYLGPDNKFFELNNDWYIRSKNPKFFGSLNVFLAHFFDVKDFPVYVEFPPGANFLVTKEQILARPIDFYQHLIRTFDYCSLAPESYFVERAISYIFNPSVVINANYNSEFPPPVVFSKFRHLKRKLSMNLLRS